jgi:shikimate dehydrogenase
MQGLAATKNVDGFSLTMPHKISGYKYCTSYSDTSRLLGVVAAARRNADGTWHGHTTDGDAFVKAQIDNGAQIEGARVLVIGCGGAGSAIAISMLEHGAREVVVHDADPVRAERLVGLIRPTAGDKISAGSADPRGFDVVSNATPLGMTVGDPLPIDVSLLHDSIFVGDVVAGHGETPLMKAARSAGCKTADGDAMVIAVLDVMCDFLESVWK